MYSQVQKQEKEETTKWLLSPFATSTILKVTNEELFIQNVNTVVSLLYHDMDTLKRICLMHD
jgi:hypothetical protein